MPPVILHIITTLERGGAEAMLVKLIGGLLNRGLASAVISLTGHGAYGPELVKMGVPVWSLDIQRTRPNPLALFRLVRLIREIQPALVQTWLYHADLLGSLAVKLAKFPGKTPTSPPICWNLRCSDMEMGHYARLSQLLPRLLGRLSHWPAAVLVNSQAGQRVHHALGYRPKAWQVIPNGFDLERYRPDPEARAAVRAEWRLSDEVPVVGLIARSDPMKDHQNFLAAAERLAQQHPTVCFVLAGQGVTGDHPLFAAAARTAPLANRLHLLGRRSDIARLMNGLDLCCLSSAFGEGFPNVLGEAMACGVPCVATDVGDAAAILGETGRIVPPRAPEALAEALAALLACDHATRRALGAAARQRVEQEFALPVIVDRYYQLYLDLIQNGVSDRH